MKTKLLFLTLLTYFSIETYSQIIPIIKVGEKHISVNKLKVDVTVLGDIAITTYDMHFYNPNNRVLEGELSFPLEENQSIIRFALGINGNLREAVVVEKEKARVAFETTVRNRIDPALLEKTKGNNYKARIYPIPAKGYKRVVLAFQQKLLVNNDAYFYKIPFNYKEDLENFSVKMKILNQKNKPIITKGFNNDANFEHNSGSYFINIEARKKKIIKPLVVKIPLNINKERTIVNNDFFYFSKQLDFKKEKKRLENDITIFWDKSLSQKNKKINTEIQFLEEYFNRVKKCKVNLIIFNTKIREEKFYEVNNGNWLFLKNRLKNVIYDGASSFDFLNQYENNTKLNLLFTDGLNTLSNLKVQLLNKTHIINSAVSANHIALKNIASNVGGHYVNLQQASIKNAFDKITTQQIQFLGTNISENLLEVYPKKGSIIQNNFSLSGKGNLSNQKIKLFFGNKNDTLKTVQIILNKNSQNHFMSKIWAQKKLNYLSLNAEKKEQEIVELSKEHQIISDFTSMLILDRVQDYVTHQIEPPKELKKEYDRLVSRSIDNEKERLANLKRNLNNKYEDFFAWFAMDFKTKIKPKNTVNAKVVQLIIDTTSLTNRELNTGFTVSGVVNAENEVLPGVSIGIKNLRRGTETDFDGKYTIDVKLGDILEFRYLGYLSKEVTVGRNRNINVSLVADDSVLDEIVVTGYAHGTSTRRTISSSVTTVNSQSISNALRGKVSGVQINNSSDTSNIVLRGASSLQTNNQPIYIVDGVVVTDITNINSQDIKSSYILNSEQSSSIYGNRASNGVVVMTTKKGGRANAKQIADFEKLVDKKVELKGWNPKTPYLKVLKSIKNTQKAYQKYLELRAEYHNSPSFFIDVADFFNQRNDKNIATQILTNVAEIDLDNYELLRALAYKFEEYKLYKYAVYMYQEILKLRPEDIQSYRDLALAYENIGEYQNSLDILYKIVNGELLLKDESRRFSGIEIIALTELNRLVSLYADKLEINHIENQYIKDIQTDVRVVIDWNHNDTDIDLWVTDPNNEKCFYSHKKTKIGGLMSDDMTEGFGPEQFVLKNVIKGNYNINVKYYANSKQKISGPTFLKITIYRNYAKENEYKVTKLFRLTNKNDVIDVGKLIF